jgi:hypothetical protein
MVELLTCCRLTKQVGGNSASVRETMADTNLPDLTSCAKAPPSVQLGGGVNCRTRWRPSLSVPRVRPDCTCRVFSTILRIVVHDFHLPRLLDDTPPHPSLSAAN